MTELDLGFQFVAKLSEIPEPGKITIELQDRMLVLVRIAGAVYCLDDVCTHDGGTLGDGELEGNCLVCPRHGAHFDVRNGDAVSMPATEATQSHQVRVVDGDVLVRLAN